MVASSAATFISLVVSDPASARRSADPDERAGIVSELSSYLGERASCFSTDTIWVSSTDPRYALFTGDNQGRQSRGCRVGDGYIMLEERPDTSWRRLFDGAWDAAPCDRIPAAVARDLTGLACPRVAPPPPPVSSTQAPKLVRRANLDLDPDREEIWLVPARVPDFPRRTIGLSFAIADRSGGQVRRVRVGRAAERDLKVVLGDRNGDGLRDLLIFGASGISLFSWSVWQWDGRGAREFFSLPPRGAEGYLRRAGLGGKAWGILALKFPDPDGDGVADLELRIAVGEARVGPGELDLVVTHFWSETAGRWGGGTIRREPPTLS